MFELVQRSLRRVCGGLRKFFACRWDLSALGIHFFARNYPLARSLIWRSASHIADRLELLALIHEKQDLCRIEPSERQRSWPRLQLVSAPHHDCLGLQCDRKNCYRALYWTKSRRSAKGRYRRFGVRSSASRFQTPAMAWECSVSARPSQGSVRALCQAEGPSSP